MTRPRVLVTRRWPAEVEAVLAERFDAVLNPSDRPFQPEDLRDALTTADAILTTVTDKFDARVLDMAEPRAKVLGNFGVGFSHIDVDAARRAGIMVTNTPDVLSDCTADLALTLMLMIARRAGEGEREVRAGGWTGWRPTHLIGAKVTGKTLGIIGFGRIGQAVARRAHFGFGMTILAQNRSEIPAATLAEVNAEACGNIDDLLQRSDFVSLHCPGGAENRHLVDGRRLSLMKRDAYLINTARGEVVDEQALAKALKTGTLGGAGLDVFDGEPNILPELLNCENAVLLPHLGSATRETRYEMGMRVVRNVEDVLAGREPADRIV
ncbi:MAG: D-glycerate dehydrogenase [Pseudomonadota bacterium]